MLNNEGRQNLENIKRAAADVWGKKCRFSDFKDFGAPFCMFEIHLFIHEKFDVLLTYDRSTLDISIRMKDEYQWLGDLTNQNLIEGFDSCKPDSLLHNFVILDNVLSSMR